MSKIKVVRLIPKDSETFYIIDSKGRAWFRSIKWGWTLITLPDEPEETKEYKGRDYSSKDDMWKEE